MDREQRKYDNAHMKGKPLKPRGDMKDSVLPLLLAFVLPLSIYCPPPTPHPHPVT